MRIERIEDKKFMVTLTEKEALRLADNFGMCWEYVKIYTLHLGRAMLHYMMVCCEFPDIQQPALDTEF